MKEKSGCWINALLQTLTDGIRQFYDGFMRTLTAPNLIRRSYVGYFAPVIAGYRLIHKRNWQYFRQLRVMYRYAFWRRKY